MLRQTFNLLEKTLDFNHVHQQFPTYFNWLHNVAPGFCVKGEQISILTKPEDFYNILLERCRSAKYRISLTSLYLGTGNLSKNLVQTIYNRLTEKENVEINILLDVNRSSRGRMNSRKMLLPLLKTFPHCKVCLFRTPLLRGPLKYLLPARYNELIGLQHMKVYLFDDSVLISGANLSEDYFTNRQDRYILVDNCSELADFYWHLINKISDISFRLNADDKVISNFTQGTINQFIINAKKNIWNYYNNYVSKNFISENTVKRNSDKYDTWIFPLIELPPFDIHQDSIITMKLLQSLPVSSNATISTGYFNLTDDFINVIINNSLTNYKILMAHPTANGFLNSKGLTRGIPEAYTALAESFFRKVLLANQIKRIKMAEYERNNWTYHAKGIWFKAPEQTLPTATVIGSSNYGARSVNRDLETQIVIITNNLNLSQQLLQEEMNLIKRCTEFNENTAQLDSRKPALWVLGMIIFFKTFF